MKQRHQSTKVKRWFCDLKHIVDEVHQMLNEIAIDAQPKKLNLLPARLVMGIDTTKQIIMDRIVYYRNSIGTSINRTME
jgi:hypothetical protein